MFTDLATLRNDVKTRLTPILPADWKYEPTLEGTIKARVPVLYIEFVAIETSVANANLPRGSVAARFNLIITDPKTDTEKAEDAVDGHIVDIIRALDPMDDLYWEGARKARLADGPLAWTFDAFAIVNTETTTA